MLEPPPGALTPSLVYSGVEATAYCSTVRGGSGPIAMFAGAAVCVGGPRSGHTHARRPLSVVRGGKLPRATGYGPRTTTSRTAEALNA